MKCTSKICSICALLIVITTVWLSAPAAAVMQATPTDLVVTMPFTDVKTSDWYYFNVQAAYRLGLLNGKTATRFDPTSNMTYAEAIKLAACMNQLFNNWEITLTNGNPWYQTYTNYAIENGIIEMLPEDFSANISREVFAQMFSKALPDSVSHVINYIPDNAIPDYKITDTYGEGVYLLYRAGVLSGSDEYGTFNPKSNITRSEVAAITNRMMDETTRQSFTLDAEPITITWEHDGYNQYPPYWEYEIRRVNGVADGEYRYTGTCKDFGTVFRLLEQCPEFYSDYGSIGINIQFANRSSKVIKYMNVYVTPYNRVNDALAATQCISFTGPFEKPTMNTVWDNDYYCWYGGYRTNWRITGSGQYKSVLGDKSITINENNVSGVYQVYHYDDIWYGDVDTIDYVWISAIQLLYMDGTTLYLSGNSLKACVW